jgi:hypothetical protein
MTFSTMMMMMMIGALAASKVADLEAVEDKVVVLLNKGKTQMAVVWVGSAAEEDKVVVLLNKVKAQVAVDSVEDKVVVLLTLTVQAVVDSVVQEEQDALLKDQVVPFSVAQAVVVEAKVVLLNKGKARVDPVLPLVAFPVEVMIGSMMTGALTMTICMMMMETITTIGSKHKVAVAPVKAEEEAVVTIGGVADGII